MKNKILLLLIGITACSMSLFAQDRKVSGIVKGKSDQELIIGANVLIKGTTLMENSLFTLDNPTKNLK